MGRDTKPDELKRMQGNPGNGVLPPVSEDDEIPAPLPDVLEYVPEPPEWLAGNGSDVCAAACGVWRTIAPLLVEARTLRAGDEFALGRYCRYCAEWKAACDDIEERGQIIVGPRGEGRNPSMHARAQLEMSIQALEKELGLTPRARTTVQKLLMAALKDLPLAGKQSAGVKKAGPVGFLAFDGDEDA